jgi:uncharacterized protein YodC (DUF2158 family)
MFNVGDLVQLKSGGPIMTVSGMSSTQTICVWFDKDEKRCSESFVSGVLKAYVESED